MSYKSCRNSRSTSLSKMLRSLVWCNLDHFHTREDIVCQSVAAANAIAALKLKVHTFSTIGCAAWYAMWNALILRYQHYSSCSWYRSCCFIEIIFGQMSPPLMDGWTSEMSCQKVPGTWLRPHRVPDWVWFDHAWSHSKSTSELRKPGPWLNILWRNKKEDFGLK